MSAAARLSVGTIAPALGIAALRTLTSRGTFIARGARFSVLPRALACGRPARRAEARRSTLKRAPRRESCPVTFARLCTSLVGMGALALSAVVASHAAGAQDQGKSVVVIHTESRMVLVDAVVRDKKGNLVRDLKASDFRVWEDGKEQSVASFSTERDPANPEREEKHFLAMFFDDSNLAVADQIAVRKDAAKFIAAWSNPDRYMAVVNFIGALDVTQNFTTKTDALERAALTIQASQNTSSAAAPIPGDPGQSRTLAVGGRGAPASRGGYTQASSTADVNSAIGRQGLLEALLALVDSMEPVRGRKTIALFGGGPPDSPIGNSEAAGIASACNRANVAIYVMNPSALQAVAEQTGGRVVRNTNDLVGELGRIADEQTERYVVGYYPAASVGGCHALRVAVARPGVDVSARKGYCTSKPAALTTASAAERALDSSAASPGANTAASIEAPYFYGSPETARVNLAMEIDGAAIKFQKVKGKPHAELTIAGVASKAGEVAGRFSDVVKLDFESDKDVAAFAKRPYHYEYQFDLGPGEYDLRVSIAGGEESVARAAIPLAIEPWDGKRLAIGGIALATEARAVPAVASDLDDVLLEDRKPLAARGLEITPSGDNRCRRTGPCLAYLELYDPLLVGANREGVPMIRYRVLDAQTGEQKYDSGAGSAASFIRPGSATVPMILEVPAAQLCARLVPVRSAGGTLPAKQLGGSNGGFQSRIIRKPCSGVKGADPADRGLRAA